MQQSKGKVGCQWFSPGSEKELKKRINPIVLFDAATFV
jgi:hypothetical protein